MGNISKKSLTIILGAMSLLILAQCDTTTTEEYKAQAVGYFEQGKKTKAYETYLKAAQKGDSDSQLIMAMLYMAGEDKPDNPFSKDDKESLKWLKKSAQQDNELALIALGGLYFHGSIVEKDIHKARHCFEKALPSKNHLALYYMGATFEYEDDSKANKRKAAEYYEKAYSEGSIAAGWALSNIYILNDDVFPDKYFYALQFSKKNKEHIRNLGIDPMDFDKIFMYDYITAFQRLKI